MSLSSLDRCHTLVTLSGRLVGPDLEEQLQGVEHGCPRVLFDCREMTGFDDRAKARFVAWHADRRRELQRVAVVISNPIWRMVISAMAIGSGVPMRPFSERDAAEQWLNPE